MGQQDRIMHQGETQLRGAETYINRLKFSKRCHLRRDERLTHLQQFVSIDQSDFDESSTAFTLATSMLDLLRLCG